MIFNLLLCIITEWSLEKLERYIFNSVNSWVFKGNWSDRIDRSILSDPSVNIRLNRYQQLQVLYKNWSFEILKSLIGASLESVHISVIVNVSE